MRLKDYFLLFLKGAIIGIANIIPGVSGGSLAVSLGIYEILLNAIGNFFKSIKKNFVILLPVIIGAVVGILASSKLVSFALEKYQAQTIFLFIGLIIGGCSLIFRKTKGQFKTSNVIILLIVFVGVVLLNVLTPSTNSVSFNNLNIIDYLLLVIVGAIATGTMIIPGISGSFVLMLIGYYEPILNTVSDLTNISNILHNIQILIPFGIGAIIGLLLIAKLIMYMLKKYEAKTYFAIVGFVLSSVVVLFMQIKGFTFNFTNIFTCILTFLWGFLLARNLEKENA